MKKFIKLTLTYLILTAPVQAQEQHSANLDMLLDLSIVDLINVRVNVASKRSESIYEAPGIVDVVTAKEIAQYGGNSLVDIIRRMPSIFLQSNTTERTNSVGLRGQHTQATDKHLLVLIDGRPIRDGFTNGSYNDIYRNFPVSLVERIEVIRGPGSVLYGSGAFAGVLNIVTKEPSENLEQQASINYGSFDTKIGEYSASGQKDELSYQVAVKGLNIRGWDYHGLDNTGEPGSFDIGGTGTSSYINLEYKDFSLTSFESYQSLDMMGIRPTFPSEKSKKRRHFVDLGYVHSFSDDWETKFNITYNGNSNSFSDNLYDQYNHNVLYEAAVDGHPYENLNFVAGVSYYDVRGAEKPTQLSATTNRFTDKWTNAYIQADYKPMEDTKIVAGLQYNEIGLDSPNYSPRIAVIQQFNRHWGGKLMYGKAFRSPTFDETHVNIPVLSIKGNPNLAPEIISTYDAQIFYRTDNLYAALTYYISTEENTISSGYTYKGSNSYGNGGRTSYKGVEFETKYSLNSQWNLQGSASYQTNESETGVADTKLHPNLLIKTGASYDSPKGGYSASIFNVHYGEPKISTVASIFNPESKAFNYLTANLSIDINKFFGKNNLPDMEFTLFADNILEDEPVYFVDPFYNQPNTLPQWAGRAAYGKLTIKY